MNYKKRRLNSKELLTCALLYIILNAVIAFIFYDSIYAFAIGIVGMPVFMAKKSRDKRSERIEELRLQFTDMIESLATVLTAGLSVENAFKETASEMERLHGSDADISLELREIVRKIEVGIPVSIALNEFAEGSEVEDICNFAVVFSEALKSGGNLKEIIKDTVKIIQEKIRIENEIQAMLKGKLLEQKVMSVIPFLIMGYLRISSSEFIEVLYHNIAGIVVMSVCLGIYVAAFIVSEKIVRIKV